MQVDQEIITSCIAKNRIAQKQLYELLLPYLRAIAYRYLRDTSYTKDVLQEGFVLLFKRMEYYDQNKGSMKAWAAKIVINVSINYNKRIIKNSTVEFDPKNHDSVKDPRVLRSMETNEILAIIKKMPRDYFEVFNLYVIDDFSHDQIAELLQISEALSRKRLSRARSWIKKIFQKESKGNVELIPFSKRKIK